MREHDEARRAAEWRILHDQITDVLNRYGRKDAFGRGDYWLVDEDLGQYRLKLEVQNLDFLRPHIVSALRGLLLGYPDWEIMFRVDVVGKEKEWPAMGLIIHDDGIVDGLQREHLPEEFHSVFYASTK
jgi:hypothetical protein